jgi:hypothetical protein
MKHHAMKNVSGVRVQLYVGLLLPSALAGHASFMSWSRFRQFPFDRRLDETQSWSECGGKDKTDCWELNPGRPARRLLTILSEISQLGLLNIT